MYTSDNRDGVRFYYCRNAVRNHPASSALAKMKTKPGVVAEAVPCGGRIDPRYILKAFESGADAVCVLTCPVGSCRLMEGNLRATCRVGLAKEFLAEAGLDAGCVQFFMPSSLEPEALDEAIENVARFVEARSGVAAGAVPELV